MRKVTLISGNSLELLPQASVVGFTDSGASLWLLVFLKDVNMMSVQHS